MFICPVASMFNSATVDHFRNIGAKDVQHGKMIVIHESESWEDLHWNLSNLKINNSATLTKFHLTRSTPLSVLLQVMGFPQWQFRQLTTFFTKRFPIFLGIVTYPKQNKRQVCFHDVCPLRKNSFFMALVRRKGLKTLDYKPFWSN